MASVIQTGLLMPQGDLHLCRWHSSNSSATSITTETIHVTLRIEQGPNTKVTMQLLYIKKSVKERKEPI